MIRSFLFVPGDSERKLEKASDAGADAVIVDLEDSVTVENRPRRASWPASISMAVTTCGCVSTRSTRARRRPTCRR